MLTVLITGFGPFPTAPANPTERLVHRLALIRRPALAGVRLAPHVFHAGYEAVDRDLPRLVAQFEPDAILMFGLAARRRVLTVETRARNAVSALLADSTGRLAARWTIVRRGPADRTLPPLSRRLPLALRATRIPARISRDAGRYVCNYLCWRASELAAQPHGPLVVFVHVPKVDRDGASARRSPGVLTGRDLLRAGTAVLVAVAAEAKRRRLSR